MGGTTLFTLISLVMVVIYNYLIPTFFAIATLLFLFGIFKYFIVPSEDNEGHEQARRYIVWGLAGLVLMFMIWGVVNLILEILGISGISTYREVDYLQMNGWGLPSDCSGGGPC